MNDTDHAILAFENEWWHHAGNKERVIQERFGISPTRYYQRLNRLLDRPEALAQQPTLVKRLQRLREERDQRRAAAPRR
ncbi:DUF3263 domain-containing protein [Saccharopolyspora erythraea]|uniref:DUF3263 domain-containing protein n=2 Tax=Saccharopolyspora erythraea TaxID=1836 RepID=A4F9X6_SACEN|nr:DUF3263 domain-containing protein [Saccharopolyspora erythraea]EQD83252.1 hypothetical protein N599_26260 [Saccharopolyspora erythraea D]QRK91369.1 DUF3263 domain-containing protein [Saccharopolyspora erythraea]CAM00851.1 hypothetical protein SACE_1529 [Saccharopolyspora erythraea NRRL 2338]